MDIGRLYQAIVVLDELVDAVGKLPADEKETAGLTTVLVRARDNIDRLVQHYAVQFLRRAVDHCDGRRNSLARGIAGNGNAVEVAGGQ